MYPRKQSSGGSNFFSILYNKNKFHSVDSSKSCERRAALPRSPRSHLKSGFPFERIRAPRVLLAGEAAKSMKSQCSHKIIENIRFYVFEHTRILLTFQVS